MNDDLSAEQAGVYRSMREIGEDERPRERLIKHGPGVLGDAELVAIVLGAGLPGENVVDLARRLMDAIGGLTGLTRSDVQELQRIHGIGAAKAAQLAAAVELGRRMSVLDLGVRPMMASPEAVYALLAGRISGLPKEQLYVLSLDARSRLIGAPTLVQGGVSMVSARVAEVFREPLVHHAASIVLVHNHPSGDPRPSPQDVRATQGLIAAAELLEIQVFDHVIIGTGRYVSMQKEGYAFPKGGKR